MTQTLLERRALAPAVSPAPELPARNAAPSGEPILGRRWTVDSDGRLTGRWYAVPADER